MRKDMEVKCIARRWTIVDPETAAQWMQSLPTARERDAATAAFTQTIAQVDPIRGSEWVPQINDPERRRIAAQLIIGGWSFRDVAAARAWLQALTGVDESWKAKTLRGLR